MNWKMILGEIADAMGKFVSKYFEAAYFLIVILTIFVLMVFAEYYDKAGEQNLSTRLVVIGLLLCPYALVLFRNFMKNDP